jgi:predicted RNase H-like nuclease (RuvC/YqgF family)
MIEDIIFNLDKHKNIRKIESDGTYIYNPPIDIKTKQDLEKLLSEKFLSNGSGLFLEDIIESLPSSAQVLKDLESEDKIIIIGGIKKRKSVFSKQIYSKYKIPNIEKIIKEEYYE